MPFFFAYMGRILPGEKSLEKCEKSHFFPKKKVFYLQWDI